MGIIARKTEAMGRKNNDLLGSELKFGINPLSNDFVLTKYNGSRNMVTLECSRLKKVTLTKTSSELLYVMCVC